MENFHQPVMLREVMAYLAPQPGQKFVDGTLGGGGYTLALATAGAQVLALDWDKEAIERFKSNPDYQKFKSQITLNHGNFAELKTNCYEAGFNQLDGLVLDLGLSSNQLQDPSRGFSFQGQGFLDMRFDAAAEGSITAFEIINRYSVEQLTEIFKTLGEERLARPISQTIRELRRQKPIRTAEELAQLVSQVYRRHFKKPSQLHPATKIFQALRLAVNSELDNLTAVLPQAVARLRPGGRLVVVSFHSLEDRIVKIFFRQAGRLAETPTLRILTKKPLTPSAAEITANPRSRSAKLRAAEKL